jgi:hypothetical protein
VTHRRYPYRIQGQAIFVHRLPESFCCLPFVLCPGYCHHKRLPRDSYIARFKKKSIYSQNKKLFLKQNTADIYTVYICKLYTSVYVWPRKDTVVYTCKLGRFAFDRLCIFFTSRTTYVYFCYTYGIFVLLAKLCSRWRGYFALVKTCVRSVCRFNYCKMNSVPKPAN